MRSDLMHVIYVKDASTRERQVADSRHSCKHLDLVGVMIYGPIKLFNVKSTCEVFGDGEVTNLRFFSFIFSVRNDRIGCPSRLGINDILYRHGGDVNRRMPRRKGRRKS